ncbi:MFS transporter [Arthrobacter sp. zg-Y179]|uniref:MFS transporter n=1 Tax=Arthrobacter sp. zg-Y179 TaxID=2894188 RepID=UPI002F3FE0C7
MTSAASSPSGTTRLLAVAILATFVAFLDGSIVTVALPAISGELGGGLPTQQWTVNAYLLTLGAFILLAGSLSDSFGRLRILRIGILGFGLSSLACALAWAPGVLILARGIQGITAALLVPGSLALITTAYHDAARAAAIGRWTAWTGTAAIIGPLLGGVLVDVGSWRLIFAVNVLPVAACLLLMTGLQESSGRRRAAFDLPGVVLAVAGLAGPVYGLIEQERLGWGHPAVVVPLAAGLLALVLFLLREARAPAPMMPLSLFRARNFRYGNVVTAGAYAGLSLGTFAVTVFVQESAGFSATAAGFTALPLPVAMLLLSARVGRLAGIYGAAAVYDRRSGALRGRVPADADGPAAAGFPHRTAARAAAVRTGPGADGGAADLRGARRAERGRRRHRVSGQQCRLAGGRADCDRAGRHRVRRCPGLSGLPADGAGYRVPLPCGRGSRVPGDPESDDGNWALRWRVTRSGCAVVALRRYRGMSKPRVAFLWRTGLRDDAPMAACVSLRGTSCCS